MRKKVATIDIYTDASDSNSHVQRAGQGRFELILGNRESDLRTPKDRKQTQTLLAHELGHFVALLTEDLTHDPFNQTLFRLTGDTSSVIPGEKLAWELAHKMVPAEEFDYVVEQDALGSYLSAGEEL